MIRKMLFILCLSFLIQSNVFASEYIADGYGPTEKAAIQDSFRVALENVVGTKVDGRTYARNNKVIRDQIYAHTDGYIRSYTIIKKSMDGDNYKVQCKVIIDTEPNSALMTKLEKLQTIKIGINDPRIGIVIVSDNGYSKATDATAENAIANSLRNNGFTHVVNMNQLTQAQQERFKGAAFEGDYATIAMLGMQEQLDYIITGNVKTNKVQMNIDTGMVQVESGRALLNEKVIKTGTGEIIQSNQFMESGVDIVSENAQATAKFKVATKAGNAIANELINYAATTTKNFTLYAHGFKTQTEIQGFEAFLHDTQGIQDVYVRNFVNSSAIIEVSFNGDAQTLAALLNNDEYYKFTVTRLTGDTLDIIKQEKQ